MQISVFANLCRCFVKMLIQHFNLTTSHFCAYSTISPPITPWCNSSICWVPCARKPHWQDCGASVVYWSTKLYVWPYSTCSNLSLTPNALAHNLFSLNVSLFSFETAVQCIYIYNTLGVYFILGFALFAPDSHLKLEPLLI